MDTRSAHDRQFVRITLTNMPIDCDMHANALMPIPKSALGQHPPTTFLNANHF